MKPIRSFLFVPGHKKKWVDNIPNFGADAVIIDLEDSVPINDKAAARAIASMQRRAAREERPEVGWFDAVHFGRTVQLNLCNRTVQREARNGGLGMRSCGCGHGSVVFGEQEQINVD